MPVAHDIDAAAPPPQAVKPPIELRTAIALPFGEDAILFQRVVDQPPVVLFDDEANAIRRALATKLIAQGRALVPIDWLERVEAAAQRGELVLEDGLRCRVAPTRAELVDRYFAGRPRAVAEALCDFESHCQLQLTLNAADGTSLILASQSIRRPEDPESWLRADPRAELDAFGMLGLGLSGMSHPPPVRFEEPSAIGAWAKPPTSAPLAAIESQASACAHPDPEVGMRWTIRAAIDPRGRVSRCSAETDAYEARDADATCLCEAASQARFPSGKRGRRLRVEAVDEGGFDGTRTTFTPIQPGTEPWIERLRASGVVRRCMATQALTSPLHVVTALSLAKDGTVEDVRIDGKLDNLERVRFAACLADGLRAVLLPCAPPGITTLHVALAIG